MVFFLCLLSLLLNGCAPTLSEIRTTNPEAIIESTKEPQSLANCLYHEMQNGPWGRVNLTTKDGAYYLLISSLYGSVVTATKTFPIAEFLVKPNSSGSVVEMRTWNLMNRGAATDLLESVKHCASPPQATALNNEGAVLGVK